MSVCISWLLYRNGCVDLLIGLLEGMRDGGLIVNVARLLGLLLGNLLVYRN